MTKAHWTSVILALGLAGCVTSTRYFPPDVDEHPREWFGKHLRAMREPVLRSMSGKASAGVTAVRVLCLPTFGHPVAVRFTLGEDGMTRRAVELTGQGGYAPGRILTDRTTSLSRDDAAALLASLDSSGFWAMPTEEPENGIVIMDGTPVIVEAVRDGAYHVIVRDDPAVAADERGTEPLYDFYANAIDDAGVGTLYDGDMVSCLDERSQEEG